MRKFLIVVIAGSFAVAASAQAQQGDDQRPNNKERPKERQTPVETQRGPKPPTTASIVRPHTASRAYPPSSAEVYPQQRIPPATVRRPQPERNPDEPPVIQDSTTASPARPAKAHDPRITARLGEKPDPQKIKAWHTNFRAQPKPQQIPPLEFDQNRRIKGSEYWPGERYEAFRNYHPYRHDRNWYHQHHHLIVLICGGYYYWDNFYWYPAWGYDPIACYYVYDGPIYTGPVAEPPDQLIADVQSMLQNLGYYDGEVDGILGPSTQDALSAYQIDNGLYGTAAIDQPTIDSLGLG